MEKKKGGFRTSIGGQALIEGILMRGPEKDAIVVRSPEGLVTKVTERKFVKDKYPILGIPILRGRGDVHQLHDHRREGADVLGGLLPGR